MIPFLITIMLTACTLAAPQHEAVGKIVNGFNLPITEAPYQVSLQDSNGNHFCGGSLIAADIVLTAAHCIPPFEVHAYMGSTNHKEGGVRIPASNIISHEEFNATEFFNDIALIRVKKPFEFSKEIQTIELSSTRPTPGTTGLASGWGVLKENEMKPPPINLQGVYLKTISLEECRKAYGKLTIQDSNFCTYSEGKDACEGDSGGPFAIDGILFGIPSWGAACAKTGIPGIHVSVADYSQWIQETIDRL